MLQTVTLFSVGNLIFNQDPIVGQMINLLTYNFPFSHLSSKDVKIVVFDIVWQCHIHILCISMFQLSIKTTVWDVVS